MSESKFPPSVTACRLYERTSAKGNRYMSGRWGQMRVTLLPTKEADKDGHPIWEMRLAQAPPVQTATASDGSQDARRHYQAPATRENAAKPQPRPAADGSGGRTLDERIPF